MKAKRWLGIDFSGNHLKWRPRCRTSNVWIAELVESRRGLGLSDLRPVQELPGDAHPFERLVAVLQRGDYEAAGIDAPFSVPSSFVKRGHDALLRKLASLERHCPGRPFPEGCRFVMTVTGQCPPLDPPKPLRRTEQHWKEQKVNVRSTLWAGARGGAPMTAACLTLLHEARCHMWPWTRQATSATLVEAFPAAQLRHWRESCPQVPYQKYADDTVAARGAREAIVHTIEGRGLDAQEFRTDMLASADALDAVLCAFAGIAVTGDKALPPPDSDAVAKEGWIAVHE